MVRSRHLNVIFHTLIPCVFLLTLIAFSTVTASLAGAQDESKPEASTTKPTQSAKSLDTVTIAPDKYVPPFLLKKATVKFEDTSIEEVAAWLQTELKTAVRVHEEVEGVLYDLGEFGITDSLNDQPIYLLLDRLAFLELDWFVHDDLIHIAPDDIYEYNLGYLRFSLEVRCVSDLIESGYDLRKVLVTIENSVSPEDWESVGGAGTWGLNRDVISFSQERSILRQVNALLDGLVSDATRTYIGQSESNLELRKKLSNQIDIDWKDLTIEQAIRDLRQQSEIDIRFRPSKVKFSGSVDFTDSITVRRDQITLEQALAELVYQFDDEIDWFVQDEVLWIIKAVDEERFYNQIVVYDVSDLVVDDAEMEELRKTIESCVHPESWEAIGGLGTIDAPKRGKFVIRQAEWVHRELSTFFIKYREALAQSKNRRSPDDVITLYYKLPTEMAKDMAVILPKMVEPKTWKSEVYPDAIGTIHLTNSTPALALRKDDPTVQEYGVLIITHTRAVHGQLDSIIMKAEHGEAAYERFLNHGKLIEGVFGPVWSGNPGIPGGSGIF